MVDVETFLRGFAAWVRDQPGVRGAALVGSWARGTPRPDSDVDLVVVVDDVGAWLDDADWIASFGTSASAVVEEWGRVRSLRVHYVDGLEVDFGFTTTEWARAPLDAGTLAVVAGGFRVLYDPDGVFAELGSPATP